MIDWIGERKRGKEREREGERERESPGKSSATQFAILDVIFSFQLSINRVLIHLFVHPIISTPTPNV